MCISHGARPELPAGVSKTTQCASISRSHIPQNISGSCSYSSYLAVPSVPQRTAFAPSRHHILRAHFAYHVFGHIDRLWTRR